MIPGRFKVLATLGEGGMGRVDRALDQETGTEVALKVLRQDVDEASLVRRFQREAASLSVLEHPNVVRLFDVLSHEGETILVMEFLPGGTLRDVINRGESPAFVVQAFADACEGLAHIHASGYVHRDVKPENILFAADGTAKIGDLGIARRLDPQSVLTAAGTILGTYHYLAPEQIMSSEVPPSADIYSLGVCLYQALAGRLPFEDKSMFALLQAHLKKSPPPLAELRPELPPALCDLTHRMLAKKAEERPSSAVEVREVLMTCVG